jgi:hypothetical protein
MDMKSLRTRLGVLVVMLTTTLLVPIAALDKRGRGGLPVRAAIGLRAKSIKSSQSLRLRAGGRS